MGSSSSTPHRQPLDSIAVGGDSVTVERADGAASTPTAKHFARQCVPVKWTDLIVGFQRTAV